MTAKKVKRVLLAILCLILTVGVIVPYGKVEFLTAAHRNEFATGYLQTGMIDGIEYLKVMAYSLYEAKVYYVAKDKTSGNVIKFTKDERSDWKLTEWETVWSTTGSADGFVWPYYR